MALLLSMLIYTFMPMQSTYAITTNTPPVVVASERIPKQTVNLGQQKEIDLSKLFYDADQDTLTYKIVPVTVGIVSAQVTNSLLTIETLAPGTTRLKVTVDDGKLGKASSSFEVEVVESTNISPTVNQEITDQTANVGATVEIDISNVFTDADQDTLTITSASTNETIATASVDTTTLSIVPKAQGTATITLTANDGNGGSVSTSFTVTITAISNKSPKVSRTISNQRATAGAEAWNIDVKDVFTDEDGDTLTITATSSDTTLVTTSLTGNTLSLTQKAQGTATITLTATDIHNASTSTNFTVTIDTPNIFISDYVQGTGNRNFLEIYNPVKNPQSLTGYAIKVYQYNTTTKTSFSETLNISSIYSNMSHTVIDSVFYDFFDITSAQYYNDEHTFTSSSIVTVAIELRNSNGTVIDVLGDPTAKTSILPNNGGYARNRSIQSGSTTFNINEWTKLPVDIFTSAGRY